VGLFWVLWGEVIPNMSMALAQDENPIIPFFDTLDDVA
jgi:hypothetical protein